MLRRKEGATIAQIVAATGWQPHTVRGAFAGALKKKLGLTVTSEKVEGAAGLPDRGLIVEARAPTAVGVRNGLHVDCRPATTAPPPPSG